MATGIKVVPNLVQGVTQQAAQQARYSQCLEQFDCVNSASEGAAARPCAELVKMYPGRDWTNAFFSETSRDNENYLLGVDASGDPFGIDLADGTDCTITMSATTTYLTGGTSTIKDKLRAQVAEDFTFIANREVTAAMAATTSAAKVNEALVFIKATYIRNTYKVVLSGPGSVSAAIRTTEDKPVGTDVIAEHLIDGASVSDEVVFTGSALNGTDGYTAVQRGSVIRITRADGLPFTLTTTDGQGDTAMIGFNGTAKSFDQLPAVAWAGMVLKVRGESRTEDDDYYVKYIGSGVEGEWVETVAPGVKTTLNAATLPHILVNTGYRAFEFKRPTWSTRIAGDGVKTSKDPSFIGKQLRDVFYHQRRLALLTDSSAVFSKADFAFTMFPDTVQTQLETAPVDIKPSSSSGTGATELDFAVQVSEKLYLWAQRQQHLVSHGTDTGFSQKTVSTDPAASYEYSPDIDPMPLGPFLYVATDVGEWCRLRALTFGPNGKLSGDVDVTAHAPAYVPGDVQVLTGAETLRTNFLVSEATRDQITVLNYFWDGQQFAQQALNTWRIPGGQILWAGVRSNYLRVIQQRAEGVALLKFNLTPSAVDPDTDAKYYTRLDIRVDHTKVTSMSYNSGTGNTTFTLPYTPSGPELRVVASGLLTNVATQLRGKAYEVVSVVGDVVTVKGDLTAMRFFVGHRITAERTELEFFIRGEEGSEPTDLLTVNRVTFSLANSGYTRLEVSATNGAAKKYVFEGRRLGSPSAITGAPPISNGAVSGEVGHASKDVTIKLVNDSFLPSLWQNGAYEFTAVGWKGQK